MRVVRVVGSKVWGSAGCWGTAGAAGYRSPRRWGRRAGRVAAAAGEGARVVTSRPPPWPWPWPRGRPAGLGGLAPSAARRSPPLRVPLSLRLRRPLEPPLPRRRPPHVGRGPSPPRGRPARPSRSVAEARAYAASVVGRTRRSLRSRRLRRRRARADVTARGGGARRRARCFAAAGGAARRPLCFAAASGYSGCSPRSQRKHTGAGTRARGGRRVASTLRGTVLSPPARARPAVAMATRDRPHFSFVTVSPPDITAGRRRGVWSAPRWVDFGGWWLGTGRVGPGCENSLG